MNGQIFIRGQREDFDHWRDLGNPGWGYDDLLPYFKKLERFELLADKKTAKQIEVKGKPLRGLERRREIRLRITTGVMGVCYHSPLKPGDHSPSNSHPMTGLICTSFWVDP